MTPDAKYEAWQRVATALGRDDPQQRAQLLGAVRNQQLCAAWTKDWESIAKKAEVLGFSPTLTGSEEWKRLVSTPVPEDASWAPVAQLSRFPRALREVVGAWPTSWPLKQPDNSFSLLEACGKSCSRTAIANVIGLAINRGEPFAAEEIDSAIFQIQAPGRLVESFLRVRRAYGHDMPARVFEGIAGRTGNTKYRWEATEAFEKAFTTGMWEPDEILEAYVAALKMPVQSVINHMLQNPLPEGVAGPLINEVLRMAYSNQPHGRRVLEGLLEKESVALVDPALVGAGITSGISAEKHGEDSIHTREVTLVLMERGFDFTSPEWMTSNDAVTMFVEEVIPLYKTRVAQQLKPEEQLEPMSTEMDLI